MKTLSPQQEVIVGKLRDMKWHCGREWLDRIKDDRARISNLNMFYMAEKGFVIKGEPCKGTICGHHKCPLYKRRAEKLNQARTADAGPTELPTRAQILKNNDELLKYFDNYQPNTVQV